MDFIFYDVEGENAADMNLRWVQPPQIAYLVTTVDRYGNTNATPVTMGTSFGPPFYYAFALSNLLVPDWHTGEYKANVKHGYYNLKEVPECVISYFGYDLLRESWIAGMPIPRGISEMDVSGLIELPSKEVKPCGIAECPVNIEARVISSHKVGSRWLHYICEIVGVSVNLKYVREDREVYDGLGVLAIDPWFELKSDGVIPKIPIV